MSHRDACCLEQAGEMEALPTSAQRRLDEIAHALGVTTALLRQGPALGGRPGSEVARLAEASALLHAFIQIMDPKARHRCLEFVREEAAKDKEGV